MQKKWELNYPGGTYSEMKTGYFIPLMAATLIACICNTANAETKKRIAVLDFFANGIDESYAIAAKTKIEVELVKLGLHVIEQRNIKKVLGERGSDFSCKDVKCATRWGKIVMADYVVVGEIIFTDKYMITARIVDVNDDRIIFADSAVSNVKDDILEMSVRVAVKLSDYLGVKAVAANPVLKRPVRIHAPVSIHGCIALNGGYVLPIAYLRNSSKNGYSLTVSAGPSLDDFFIGIKTGFIQLFGSKTKPYAYIMPVMASFRYELPIKNFSLSMSMSAGMTVNYIDESKKTSAQPVVNPGFTLGYKTEKFRIYTLAEYFCIAEIRRGIQFFNFGLGASICF
jgi:hypothetical protein